VSPAPAALRPLDVDRARALCAARGVPWPIEYHASIGSTQDRARELALAGAPETVVFAEQQKRGRGQRGRTWYSPAGGGNWLTLVLYPDLDPARYPLLTLAAGVAIAEAVEEVTGAAAAIKWPNDVLVEGKKCAGILAESDATRGWAILGIGVDVCAELPPGLADHAVSLHQVVGRQGGGEAGTLPLVPIPANRPHPASLHSATLSRTGRGKEDPLLPAPSSTSGEGSGGVTPPRARGGAETTTTPPVAACGEGRIEREVVLAAELAAVQRWIERLHAEPEAVIAAVAARDALRGRPVTIDTPAGRTEGIARGIDPRGALLVETRSGAVIPCFAGIAQLRKDSDG